MPQNTSSFITLDFKETRKKMNMETPFPVIFKSCTFSFYSLLACPFSRSLSLMKVTHVPGVHTLKSTLLSGCAKLAIKPSKKNCAIAYHSPTVQDSMLTFSQQLKVNPKQNKRHIVPKVLHKFRAGW